MKITQTLMTPADAAKLLEHNTINRKLSRARARALTATIERGEWQLDGNPIKIGEDGTVIDGQHRLRAIADAQIDSAPVLLITGLPASTRMVIDCGRSRNFADYLEISGVPNSQSMAAAVRGFWTYDNGLYDWRGDWFKRPVPSNLQLWELYDQRRKDFEEAISRANQVIRVVRVSRAAVATAWVVLGDVQCDRCGPIREDLEEFGEQLAMRSAGVQSDGVMTFIRLMNRRGGGGTETSPGRNAYTQTDQLALLLKAWNAYREGRPVTMLVWKRGGKNREKFPVPH